MDERGGYHVFPSKSFCDTVLKNFIRNLPVFRKGSGSEETFMDKTRHITFHRRIFFVSRYRKKIIGEKLGGSEVFPVNFHAKDGNIRFCRENFNSQDRYEIFVNCHFCFPENFCKGKKNWATERWESLISVDVFRLTVLKNFLEEPSSSQKTSGV